jgi:hypothetical protein
LYNQRQADTEALQSPFEVIKIRGEWFKEEENGRIAVIDTAGRIS